MLNTGNDAGTIAEHISNERGRGQRGVRHEQADGVCDQVSRMNGDSKLRQNSVDEQRGGQENGAHHEIRAVQYLAEFERIVIGDRCAGQADAAQATGEQHVGVLDWRARRRKRVRHHLHCIHAVSVAFDGHHATVNQHPAVRQKSVSYGIRA